MLSTLDVYDVYAPERTREVVLPPCAPWYSTDVSVQKNIRRKLERNWRRTRLPADRERYVFQNSVVNDMIPLQIRLSSSEAVFKANLKTYLFKRAFDL